MSQITNIAAPTVAVLMSVGMAVGVELMLIGTMLRLMSRAVARADAGRGVQSQQSSVR